MSQPRSSSVPQYFQTMSPVPPEPTASRLPPSVSTDEVPTNQSEAPPLSQSADHNDLPEPLLRLELRDLRDEATKTFLDHVEITSDFPYLVEQVVKLLYYPSSRHGISSSTQPTKTSTRPAPHKPHIPPTRSVTLIPRGMDGVAYTTGLDLDNDHKEIHFSLSYINHVAGSSKGDKARIRKELLGVLCHELVHCYQWNGKGSAPGGLIEGIADWIRLRAGFVPPHWKREAGDDKSWDDGYQTTGYFLDWLENAHGEGSVRRINATLRENEYDEDKFWHGLFGKNVEDLWKMYAKNVRKEADGV